MDFEGEPPHNASCGAKRTRPSAKSTGCQASPWSNDDALTWLGDWKNDVAEPVLADGPWCRGMSVYDLSQPGTVSPTGFTYDGGGTLSSSCSPLSLASSHYVDPWDNPFKSHEDTVHPGFWHRPVLDQYVGVSAWPISVVDGPNAFTSIDCAGRATWKDALEHELLPALEALPCSYAICSNGEVRVSALVDRCYRVVARVRVFAVPQPAAAAATQSLTLSYFRTSGEEEASLHFFTMLEAAVLELRRRHRHGVLQALGGTWSPPPAPATVVDKPSSFVCPLLPPAALAVMGAPLAALVELAHCAHPGSTVDALPGAPEVVLADLHSAHGPDLHNARARAAACLLVQRGRSLSRAAGNLLAYHRLMQVLEYHDPNCVNFTGDSAGVLPSRDVFVSVAIALADGYAAASTLGLLPKYSKDPVNTTTTGAAARLQFEVDVLEVAANDLLPALLTYVRHCDQDVEGSREVLVSVGRVLETLGKAKYPSHQTLASFARSVVQDCIPSTSKRTPEYRPFLQPHVDDLLRVLAPMLAPMPAPVPAPAPVPV